MGLFLPLPEAEVEILYLFPDLLVRVLESPLTCCIQLVYTQREGKRKYGRSDSNGEGGRVSSQKKKKKNMSHSCSAVRPVEATVRAEIGTSASPVMDVSLNDCCTSVRTDGFRQKLCPFDSEADAQP